MIETPVRSSPAMIARSTGAAPRQRGSSEGCTFRSSCSESSGSLMSAPNAHTTTTGREEDRSPAPASASAISARASAELTLSGCSTASPRASARSRTGGALRLLPRPAGRSGRVMTRAGRNSALAATRSSTAAANSEVPMKTIANARQAGSP